jgi:predicted acyl esterase
MQVASSAADGAFFVYLEDVAPDGRVTLLDDGQQRAVGGKLEVPHKLPYEPLSAATSISRDEAKPLVPGEPVELKIRMWPTSLVVRKGHQLRIALAGADTGFRRYPPFGDVTWTVFRQQALNSYVDLPMRSR